MENLAGRLLDLTRDLRVESQDERAEDKVGSILARIIFLYSLLTPALWLEPERAIPGPGSSIRENDKKPGRRETQAADT